MTQNNKMFDEFAKLMSDAAGVAQGVRDEAEGAIRTQLERFMGDMDLVTRDEFEAVKEMAVTARDENDKLAARIAVLEAKLGIGSASVAEEAFQEGTENASDTPNA